MLRLPMFIAALAALMPTITVPAPTLFHFHRYGEVALYSPNGPVKGVVLFMSGDDGWRGDVAAMARQMTTLGLAVAGIRTPAYLRAWVQSRDRCINANVDLVALAQEVEHRLGLRSYVEPVLAGYGSGSALTYATLAQAPVGLYRGAVSFGFEPLVRGTKPYCGENGLAAIRVDEPRASWRFAPVARVPAPWLVLQNQPTASLSAFVGAVGGATLLPKPSDWPSQFEATLRMLDQAKPTAVRHIGLPTDLPLTPVVDTQAPPSDLMAVFYSGDGGWAGLDRSVSADLAAAGVPVVGVNSLQYFWNAKTPALAARDLARIIDGYGALWQRPRVALIGYSFGAGVLPAIVDALPPLIRARVAQTTLMGLPAHGEFEFHLASWLDASQGPTIATVPVVRRIADTAHVQCIRGLDEDDSACLAIPPIRVQQIALPGGHHFDGDAAAVTKAILGGLHLSARGV